MHAVRRTLHPHGEGSASESQKMAKRICALGKRGCHLNARPATLTCLQAVRPQPSPRPVRGGLTWSSLAYQVLYALFPKRDGWSTGGVSSIHLSSVLRRATSFSMACGGKTEVAKPE